MAYIKFGELPKKRPEFGEILNLVIFALVTYWYMT